MPVLGNAYEAARREHQARREPTQINMGGELFTLLPTIPIASGFDLMDAPDAVDGDTFESQAIKALATFIRFALVDEDQPRWDALLARRVDAVDPLDIVAWGAMIAEVYSPVPTVPSAGSSGGRRQSGKRSKPNGPNRGTSPT